MSECCTSSSLSSGREAVSATDLPTYVVRPGVTVPDWSVVTSPAAKTALLALVESGHVLHRWSGYAPAEDRLRTVLLRLYTEDGRAPSLGTLAKRAGLTEATVRPLLEGLRQRDLVVLDADGKRIVGAYPFTDRETGHRVRLDGRSLSAMCAVDALGIGAMSGRDIAIDAGCRHCGAPIRITTRDRGRALSDVQPAMAVVWLSVRYEGECAASSLCAATAFFCTDDHLAGWRRERHSNEPGFRLSIDEALEVGRAIFGQNLGGLDRHGEVAEARDASRPSTNTPSKETPMIGRRSGAIGRNGGPYDLAIVGAGSAGFSAAITAADEGAQVALIGHGAIGGTCVNVGCVPSKTLIRAAEALHSAHAANRFRGIEASAKVTDWKAVVQQKQELVDGLRKTKYIGLLPAYNSVSYREGKASFGEDGALRVDGKKFSAKKIIITTGARPALPPIQGIADVPYLTSTTALELETLPKSLLVIGAGYVGAEIAQLFARAGVKVTIVSRRGLLPEAEPEIGEALTRYFTNEGIEVVSGIAYERIEADSGNIRLHVMTDGKPATITANKVLIATGRAANTESLNLAFGGIETNANNSIKVDLQMRTTRDGVYAAGDVTGQDQFVYMAAYGAKIAAKNAMNGNSLSYDNSIMPEVVFTDPQAASVGLTEAEARSQGIDVKTSILTLDNVPRALAARDTRGLIKLVAESKTGKLIGAHILAPEGSDSIQTAAMAIKAGMTHQDMASMIFPYLTTVEGLKLAAQTFDKDVKMLSCCAG